MRWNRRHHSCGIVKMASNDEKRLYVFGGYHSGHWRYWYDPSKIRNVLLQEMGHLHEPGHHEWVPPRVRHPLPDQRHEVCQDRPLPLHADWRQHSQLGGHKHCQLVPLERCKLQVFLKKQKNVPHRNCRVVRAEADMLYSHLNAPAVAVPVTKARIKSCAEPYALPPP